MHLAPDWQAAYLLASSATLFAFAALAGCGVCMRSSPVASAFTALAAFAAGWIFATLMLAMTAPSAGLTWLRWRHTFAVLSPPAVAWFLLELSGWMPSRRRTTIAALFSLPVFAVACVWIEPRGQGWVIAGAGFAHDGAITYLSSVARGPVWWLAMGWSYALVLGNIGLAIAWAMRAGPLARGQALAAAVGIVGPAVANAAQVLRLPPPWLDPVPLGFALTAVAIVHGVLRHRMLDLVPVARRRVVDAMDDGMLATDAQGRVVDLNPSMAAILGRPARDVLGRPAAELLATLGDLSTRLQAASAATGPDGTFATIRDRHYGVRLIPLPDDPSGTDGRLLLLHDLTARVVMERERDRLIQELREAIGQVRTLRGLLPLCASCKNVRDGAGRWRPVDAYIRDHSLATVSHGICPDCAPRRQPGPYHETPRDD